MEAELKERQFSSNADSISFIDTLVILILGGISIGIVVLGNYLDSHLVSILGLLFIIVIAGVSVLRFISSILDLTDRLKQR